jgi:outer membrane protein TolC
LKEIALETDVNEVQNIDYQSRIEYSLLETQKKLDQLNLKNTRAGYYPSIYLIANTGANIGAIQFGDVFGFDKWRSFLWYGVRINVPIFDGLNKKYRIQQNRLTLTKTENQQKELTRLIDFQTQQATITLKNNLMNLETHQRTMKLASEVSKITKLKYQEGVGSNIEVLNAETAYKEAETNYYSALYDVLISKIDLQKAKGELRKEQK